MTVHRETSDVSAEAWAATPGCDVLQQKQGSVTLGCDGLLCICSIPPLFCHLPSHIRLVFLREILTGRKKGVDDMALDPVIWGSFSGSILFYSERN